MLRLENLTTGYRNKVIGKNLCGHLQKGTLTALLGLNGCGKSTLLRSIARLQNCIEGNIYIQGKNISQYRINDLAKQLSIVLTYHPEVSGLTALDVVKMGRIPYRTAFSPIKTCDDNIIANALQLTHTSTLAMREINTLSDGERQRIFIAKALAQDTPLILLDEPTAYLDFASKVSIMKLLSHLAKTREKTILLSTHDVELSLHFADNLWLLRNNSITEGSPQHLSQSGDINQFFSASGVTFDAEEMRFCYQ